MNAIPEKPHYKISLRTRLARVILRPLFRILFHILSRVRIDGREHVPKKGAYIIAVNHISIYEPPFVLAFWPVVAEAIAAAEIWERRGQAALVSLYGAMKVHRREYDRELINTALAALAAGKPLVVFPEGGRSHIPGLRRAFPGVAYLVEKIPVPVVPVGIVGSTADFLQRALHRERPILEMHIGLPFTLPAITGKGEERRHSRQHNADLIMAHIAALLPPEYRGVYGETACPNTAA